MIIEQSNQGIRFSAFYTSSGLAKTGLALGSVLTVDVYKPNGTTLVSGAAPSAEDGSGWYHYNVSSGTVATNTGLWVATFKSTDATCDQQHIGDRVYVGPTWANNLDTNVNSRSSLTAAGIWAYSPRTVTSYGTLLADVWSYTDRELTAFDFDVTVGTNSDKTGYVLASSGLDAIAITDPGVVASHTTFPKLIVAVYRYFYKKTTATATQLKTYGNDNSTVNVTMVVSNDGTTQTKGAGT